MVMVVGFVLVAPLNRIWKGLLKNIRQLRLQIGVEIDPSSDTVRFVVKLSRQECRSIKRTLIVSVRSPECCPIIILHIFIRDND